MSLFDKKHLVSPADALPGRNTPMPVATLHAVNGHSMTNVPDGRIVNNAYRFGMTRITGAHFPISRIWRIASGIACGGAVNAG